VYKSGVAPVPFNVVLLDRHTGSAKLVVSAGFHLDYEQKQTYDFDVAADDCVSGSHGPRYIHTHNRFTVFLEYARDYPGEQVPER